jgi:hypothetical protein
MTAPTRYTTSVLDKPNHMKPNVIWNYLFYILFCKGLGMIGSDKICTASCTYIHVLSLCHLYPLPFTWRITSGKGNLQMTKNTPHFVLNFLQISTFFASFSRAHARTLQNHSISPCTTTVLNNSHSGIIYYISQQSHVTHQLVLWNLVVIHIIIIVTHETIDGQPRHQYIITFGLAYGSGQPFSLAHSTT